MKRLLASILFGTLSFLVLAQDIKLPPPAAKAGLDLLEAIRERAVSKTFVKRGVGPAELSTLLWAGLGPRGADAVSSATKAGRTISFSGDNPYINLYVLDEKGTWKYLPDSNTLKLQSRGDSRQAVSRAAVPNAAFMVLFTVDGALTPSFLKSNPGVFLQMAHATAGFAAQNLALAATARKLAVVVQYTLTPQAAASAALLSAEESPLFIMQLGYTD